MRSDNVQPCKECGHLISRTADACPRCGASDPNNNVGGCLNVGCLVPLITIAVIFVVMVIAIKISNTP